MNFKYWFPISLALIVAGLGISSLDQRILNLFWPLFIAAGIFIVVLITTKGIVSLYHQHDIKVYYKSSNALEYAKQTYKVARNHGGLIQATHILQHRVDVKKDIALKELLDNITTPVIFKRVFVFKDKKEENIWIKSFFSMKKANLSLEAFFWNSYNLTTRHSFINLLPRFNLLLYKDDAGNIYRVLVGFERVRSRATYSVPDLNIGFSTSSKGLYGAFDKYFESILKHPEIVSSSSLELYKEQSFDSHLTLGEQSVIRVMVDFSYMNNNVVHLGAFGSTAYKLNEISVPNKRINHLSDVDLFVVVKNNKMEEKAKIKEELNEKLKEVEVVFGDDENYYYNFRSNSKIVVDIEVFEEGEKYYGRHMLLGYSIFSNYITLLMEEKTLSVDNLIEIPTELTTLARRVELCLNDRKGIVEFLNKLKEKERNTIDPRRILTIVLANISWAISGTRPSDSSIALEHLKTVEIINTSEYVKMLSILDMSEDTVKRDYSEVRERAIEIVQKMKVAIEALVTEQPQ